MGRAAVRRETAFETTAKTIGALVSAAPCRFFGTFLDGTRKVRTTQWSKPKYCLHFRFRRKFLKITKHFTTGAKDAPQEDFFVSLREPRATA